MSVINYERTNEKTKKAVFTKNIIVWDNIERPQIINEVIKFVLSILPRDLAKFLSLVLPFKRTFLAE